MENSMKTTTLKNLACITALIFAPSIAFAGGTNSQAEDKATTGHTRDSETGTRGGEMPKDDHRDTVNSDGMTDDTALVNNVEKALKADALTSALDIKVQSSSGAVTLTGTAAGTRWKSRAAIVAAGVKGVKSVKNDIEIGN
jgi:hyperosmotically inducible periplasmic protein